MRPVDRLLQRWRAAVAIPRIPPGASVLDIGCHRGELLRKLRGRIGPSVGLDPEADESADGRVWLLRDKFPPAEPLPVESFDAVVMLATLEHITDKDAVVAECARVLNPGGRVIVTLPSVWVDPLVALLRSVGLADGMSLEEHHGFDPRSAPALFARHGFVLDHWRPFQFGLNNLFVFRRPPSDTAAERVGGACAAAV